MIENYNTKPQHHGQAYGPSEAAMNGTWKLPPLTPAAD